jgi:hypothetical protein
MEQLSETLNLPFYFVKRTWLLIYYCQYCSEDRSKSCDISTVREYLTKIFEITN